MAFSRLKRPRSRIISGASSALKAIQAVGEPYNATLRDFGVDVDVVLGFRQPAEARDQRDNGPASHVRG